MPRQLNMPLHLSADDSDTESISMPPFKAPVPYEGPIFEANRYVKRVTVTFRGLLREKLW